MFLTLLSNEATPPYQNQPHQKKRKEKRIGSTHLHYTITQRHPAPPNHPTLATPHGQAHARLTDHDQAVGFSSPPLAEPANPQTTTPLESPSQMRKNPTTPSAKTSVPPIVQSEDAKPPTALATSRRRQKYPTLTITPLPKAASARSNPYSELTEPPFSYSFAFCKPRDLSFALAASHRVYWPVSHPHAA